MNSYNRVATPATIGVLAGVIMLGVSVTANSTQVASMDRMIQSDVVHIAPATNSNGYAEFSASPTLGLHYDMSVVSGDQILHQASLNFAQNLSSRLESLGREYMEVIEDNFWDLVVR